MGTDAEAQQHAGDVATQNLRLVPNTLADIRAIVDGLSAEQRGYLSADWVAQLNSGTLDRWTLGYHVVHQQTGETVGKCGFKTSPSSDGIVEIAYATEPDHEGRGYATEVARALVTIAFSDPQVRLVIAHTISPTNASARVLTKCGFHQLGEIMDPEDGLVWRWQKPDNAA